MRNRWRAVVTVLALVAAGSAGAALTTSSATAAPVRYEAETAAISQGVVESNHLNFSGTGFVNGDNVVGSSVQWSVTAAAAGTATIAIRYSNGTTTGRPADIAVNGTVVAAASAFGSTTNWDTWATKTVTAPVNAGANTIRVTSTTTSGPANLDYVDVDVAAVPAGPDYQAENALISQGSVATNHTGYTGTGFVDYTNITGSYVEWSVTAATAGPATITVRYANGTTINRPMSVAVNGTAVATPAFGATANWDTWTTVSITATLTAGANTVRATATTDNGGPNVDKITVGTGSSGGPAVPFGSHQFPYVSGILRPSGSQSTLDAAVVVLYNKWKANFVKQNCGNGWYEVLSPDADHPYVAEGQGYGMVITATMAGADPNAKTIFDGMVKYMLAHPSVNNADLLAAEQDSACASVDGSDSATDGDLDVAFGLLLADKQWGSAGTYNYKQLAVRHINAIKASEINPATNLLRLGDWSTCCDALYYTTRPSDFMLDHMRAFKAATGDPAWDTIRTAHQTLVTNLQTQYAAGTGLLPDFVVTTNTTPKPAPGEVLEGPNDGKYYWNSCRTPWRIGADAVTSGASASLTSARKLNTWIKSKTGGNPNSIADGYSLSGSAIDSGNDACFVAPFAVAAMTDPGSQAWLDSLWSHLVNTSFGSSEYYNTSVQLQVMIVASGNFWLP